MEGAGWGRGHIIDHQLSSPKGGSVREDDSTSGKFGTHPRKPTAPSFPRVADAGVCNSQFAPRFCLLAATTMATTTTTATRHETGGFEPAGAGAWLVKVARGRL